MTEQMAIIELQQNIDLPFGGSVSDEASEIAIKALEEIQQYRALGTVEELRVARDKQMPKKPFKTMDENNPYYKYMPWCCPYCRETLYEDTEWDNQEFDYCTECGQKLDWGDE